jgi:hypothetical protein
MHGPRASQSRNWNKQRRQGEVPNQKEEVRLTPLPRA